MSGQISVELYKPHPKQKIIHDAINSGNQKYYVLNIGRQFGKSLLATNQLCYWLLNERCEAAWVSPVFNQANKVYEQIVKAFKDTGIITKKDAQKLKVEFCNGSTLQFFSAERYDNMRGFTFDYLVCDEFAFMDGQAWTAVLRATVLVKGKKVLLISTPNGKNHFYQLFMLDGVNDQYKSFKMSSYDNPMIDPKEIDDAKLTLPNHIFRQEYLAEFVDGGNSVFGDVYYSTVTTGTRYYGGLDVARADDYTVLTVYNEAGNMVYIDRWRHDSWANIVKKAAEIIDQYNAQTFVEMNSIGDPIFEMLKGILKNKNNVQPFVTTSKSKQDIIEQLAVANQNKEVSFLPVEWLQKEFDVFTYEYNPKTRSIKYSAPSGFHDDGIMSSAIGYEAVKKLKIKGVYSFA
jgi:hypothetical protein